MTSATSPQSGSATRDQITIMAPDGTVSVVPVAASEMTVGRKPESTIVLDYPDVSPLHARIQFDGTNYYVTDLNSTNGTFLGNVRLLPGVPQVWAPDKAVRVGQSWLRLERGSAPLEASATATPATQAASSTPRVAAFVETTDLTVDPGASTLLTIAVLNQGPVVDHLQVSVLNLPASWLPGPMPVVRLLPGARQPVSLTIAPPRTPESRAGTYPVTIRVTSQEAPDQFADVQVRLTVNPYAQFQGELRPQSVRAGRPAQVRIENLGNAPQTYKIAWRDRAEELAFDPPECQVTVPEGQAGVAEFRATVRKRALVGGEKHHSFSTEVTSPSGEKQTLAGEAISRALIPRWLPPLLLVVLLAAAALVAMLLSQGRQPPTINSLTVDPPSPVAGQPVTVRWSVKGAQTVELRPLVAGIDASAGEYTFSEGLPPGANLTFVAQNQYGSTERPLALAVREPTPTPTATLTPTPEPGAPVIKEWSVSPLTVIKGQVVTIRWAVENAESVTLQPIGTVDLSGTAQEKPGATTRYTLIATNKGKTVQRSYEVIVEEATPTPTAKVPTLAKPVITPLKPLVPVSSPTPTPTVALKVMTPVFRIPTPSP